MFSNTILALSVLCLTSCAQVHSPEQQLAPAMVASKIEPPNWWVGMKWNRVQLMLTGEHFEGAVFAFVDDALKIKSTSVSANGNYAFVDVEIPEQIEPGNYTLTATRGDITVQLEFPILSRNLHEKHHQGFGPKDIVYLITPDRFANGNRGNDRFESDSTGLLDEYDPTRHGMRHGGDLLGIIDHLDYLEELGVTTLWLNPVLENRGDNSYHGYSTTDHYRVDPRFGSNPVYRKFVEEAHARGLKVIFDHISNHIGIKHPWINALPATDWLNGSVKDHLTQKHYLLSISDPHADADAQKMLKTFWFVDAMPDLNQKNPELANYLIQNTLWWIEYSGIDGIREDTYPYADQAFMTRWAKAIRDEYPKFNIVGEIWAVQPAYIAQFQEKTILPRRFETHLPAVMDFPLMNIWRKFLSGEAKLRDVHEAYSQDFLYTDLNNLVVFLDNHDISRALFHADGDRKRFKLALTMLMTSRGIPQILYGTEIGMMGGESHVELRADFPGGFPNSKSNAFTREGRTVDQNEMFDFCQKLFELRKNHPALSLGKMIHYAPTWHDDTYKVLKLSEAERILIVANGNDHETKVDLSELDSHLEGVTTLRDLLSGEELKWSPGVKPSVSTMTARIFLLVD